MWHAGADPTISTNKTMPPLLGLLKTGSILLWTAEMHYALDSCLKAGSPYIDFQEKVEYDGGRGYWLEVCMSGAVLSDPSLLRSFADRGANTAETDAIGFNCLFVFMSQVDMPGDARELKALQCLLTLFDDIYTLDTEGNDIFAYVNERRDWPTGYQKSFYDCGSYKQDLWYSVLARSKLNVRHDIQPCDRLARYTINYTPQHYLALCHLDDWEDYPCGYDGAEFRRQIQALLEKYPLSEEEERIQREMEFMYARWESRLGSNFEDDDYGSGDNDGSEREDERIR